MFFFVIFSERFSGNSNLFFSNFLKFETPNLGVSECSQGLRILPPILTARNFAVIEI